MIKQSMKPAPAATVNGLQGIDQLEQQIKLEANKQFPSTKVQLVGLHLKLLPRLALLETGGDDE